MITFDDCTRFLPIKAVAEYFYCQRAAFYMLTNWENDEKSIFFYKGTEQHIALQTALQRHRPNAKVLFHQFVISRIHKIYGICDAIELRGSQTHPIEYKTGKVRTNMMHRAQLHLQALCIKEMFGTKVPHAYIYFIDGHARRKIALTTQEEQMVLRGLRELRKKLRNPRIQYFKPCGRLFCSYHDVDDQAIYRSE